MQKCQAMKDRGALMTGDRCCPRPSATRLALLTSEQELGQQLRLRLGRVPLRGEAKNLAARHQAGALELLA
eukprot:CAMPEP_0194766542 /NCGR_PEP_ID=MMETSP0323_2-20130528/31877_1 /TAXON_ID=2866 ORGANISM="Crypthecodinium cohnii, Strain Seligo" /NCGR_SAMPLE_ID=MMETSP0323_2 /ASSEMBLY_ACC=CAM_ASM_000346 /LENGTH=70 /DNA_ID=CAMNT_0039697521 /DNA_START=155 /DNA_END=364 /DNA_ORIENTATION=+